MRKAGSAKDTFRSIAEEYVEKLKKEGRADRTISKVKWLLDFAYPTIGDKCIREIDPATVLTALRRVEVRGRYESARRLRSTIGTVFRYAIATARAEADPTIALRGALISPMVTPRAAIIDPKALGGLLRAVDAFDGQPTTRTALKLMAMLFPRPGELRAAEWEEFDFESAVWIIPEARMKMRRPHRVPLSRQAVSVLTSLKKSLVADRCCFLVFDRVRVRFPTTRLMPPYAVWATARKKPPRTVFEQRHQLY